MPKEAKFDYAPIQGEAVFSTVFPKASDGVLAGLGGHNFREGLLAATIKAELLAAQAGIVPYYKLPDGTKGVVVIGAAREKINKGEGPEAVRKIYLGVHGAVRTAHDFARKRGKDTPRIDGTALPPPVPPLPMPPVPGLPPFPFPLPFDAAGKPLSEAGVRAMPGIGVWPTAVLVLIGVGLVAVIGGGAWYYTATKETEIEVAGQNLRATYAAGVCANLATAALAAGKDIPPECFDLLKGLADGEKRDRWAVPLALGAVGFTVLAGIAWGIRSAFAK